MLRSRLAEATLIGCLASLASFCALCASAEETYSIVAQSTRSSAATGRLPLSARIAAANLPIITPQVISPSEAPPADEAVPKAIARVQNKDGEARVEPPAPAENMAVAAVRVDHELEVAAEPTPRPSLTMPVLWPFGAMKWPTASSQHAGGSAHSSATKASMSKAKSHAHGHGQSQSQGQGKGQSHAQTQAVNGTTTAAAGRGSPRQANARSNGKGLSSSSPASVTR